MEVVDELDFNDEYEVYWVNDVAAYLEELFTTLLFEMHFCKEYSKFWMETPLTTESEVRDFYRLNRESIIENKKWKWTKWL